MYLYILHDSENKRVFEQLWLISLYTENVESLLWDKKLTGVI